jgi:UDP-2,3-diacylglucosamine hydrolase
VQVTSRLAILCAGGDFPLAVAKAAKERGENPFLVLLEGLADTKLAHSFDCATVRIGQYGKIIDLLKKHNCTRLISVGFLVRPHFWSVLPDFKLLTKLPILYKAYKGGDNHLLSAIAKGFESEGITYLGVHDAAPQLLMPKGILTTIKPNDTELADIQFGLKALESIGDFDIGQALIIHHNHIVAVEGAEGTDGLLKRMKEMRETKRVRWPSPAGLLVKALKPNQDKRLDMPAIGLNTLQEIHAAGLKGLAVQAGGTLVLEGQSMIDYANDKGLFIVGV